MNNAKKTHEAYHTTTTSQLKIIPKNNFTYKIILPILKQYLQSKKTVLDIGCGAGTLSFYLASKGHDITGIDISSKAIQACKKSALSLKIHNIKFQVMDFPYTIPSEKYDVVICSEVIEHLVDDTLALKKIYLLLKKNGIAIFSTPSKNAPMYKMGLADSFDKTVGHVRRYTLEELITNCKKTGFHIIETKKTEGVVRNFLFLNPLAGKFIRFIKFFLVDVVSFIDEVSLKLFGESQIFVIVKKP